jgi:hypothetical protein
MTVDGEGGVADTDEAVVCTRERVDDEEEFAQTG